MPRAAREQEAVEGELRLQATEGYPLVQLLDRVDALDALPPAAGDVLEVGAVEDEAAEAIAVEGQLRALALLGLQYEPCTAVGIAAPLQAQAGELQRVQPPCPKDGRKAVRAGQRLRDTCAMGQRFVLSVLRVRLVDEHDP